MKAHAHLGFTELSAITSVIVKTTRRVIPSAENVSVKEVTLEKLARRNVRLAITGKTAKKDVPKTCQQKPHAITLLDISTVVPDTLD